MAADDECEHVELEALQAENEALRAEHEALTAEYEATIAKRDAMVAQVRFLEAKLERQGKGLPGRPLTPGRQRGSVRKRKG